MTVSIVIHHKNNEHNNKLTQRESTATPVFGSEARKGSRSYGGEERRATFVDSPFTYKRGSSPHLFILFEVVE
jgi:hypothetical protein